ncbi:hypothetical protein ACN4EG_06700 [Alkalinema pantanalense CENA528]|uniref:hypothetical protein n=1 Tax=Alkalinema pantanalense TaxID=1620705 RepID=UPI003D6FB520
MFTSEQIQKIAQLIQPKLFDLLPHETANFIQTKLTQLIEKSNAGEAVEQEILDLLYEQERLHPYLTLDSLKSFDPLPGNSAPIPSSLIYRCPDCDYITDVPFLGMTPDPCPNHPTTVLISN